MYLLPKNNQRNYLSSKFNSLNKKHIQGVLEKLLNAPPTDFLSARKWFGLYHEFSCAINEAQSILELNLNLEKNETNEKYLRQFENDILIQLLNAREKMMFFYLNSPYKYAMHAFDNHRIEKELLYKLKHSSKDLSSYQIEENVLIRNYKNWNYQKTVYFEGRHVSLGILVGKMSDDNLDIRKKAFFSYWNFIKENEEGYQNLFDKILSNRRRQAEVVGSQSYTEVAFSELGRIDYSPNDCALFRDSILKVVVPKVTEMSYHLGKGQGLENFFPWDMNQWKCITPQERPCGGSMDGVLDTFPKFLQDIHPLFERYFNEMKKNRLFHVIPKKGKVPGAFSVSFAESGLPFLFGNFGANTKDLFTLIHEFGHCIHTFASAQIQNILLRQPGYEMCEVASLGLELLSWKSLSHFWRDPRDAQKAFLGQIFQMLQFWPFMSMIDEWQHQVYSSGQFVSSGQRNELWRDLSKKYKPHLDWSECDSSFEELGWLSRHHIFTSPFYFIDYGIAQMGALQLLEKSESNYSDTVDTYLKGLSLGGQLSLPDLFQKMQIELCFEASFLAHLVESVVQRFYALI